MQKFITGLAFGIVAGTLLSAYSKAVRDLAVASKDYASKKLEDAKDDMQDKTDEIKDKTENAMKTAESKLSDKKPKPKRQTAQKQDAKEKTNAIKAE